MLRAVIGWGELDVPIVDVAKASGKLEQLRGRAHVGLEEPLGHDVASARALNVPLQRDLRQEPHLSKRLLSRQGGGPQPCGLPLREQLPRQSGTAIVSRASSSPWPRTSVPVGRGALYEGNRAIRDVLLNHLLQSVGILAIGARAANDREPLRNAVAEISKQARPIVETVAAVRLSNDSRRWEGVQL